MPTTDSFIQDQLALLAWREGHAGSQNLMNAIMLAHANRIRTGLRLGSREIPAGDWMADFRQHRSISPWFEFYEDEMTRMYPDTRDPVFQGVLHTATLVYDGAADVLIDGAMFYADPGSSFYNPLGWFHSTIASDPGAHPRTATISGWSFYR